MPPDAGVVQDAVTGVSVTGADRIASKVWTVLTAVVEGTGTFSPDVTWIITSGVGRLSTVTGTSVTYVAPFVREDAAVTVQAVSQANPSKVGVFTFTVSRAPAARLMAGTHEGLLSVTSSSQPAPSPQAQKYTLAVVSDTQVLLTPVPGFPKGILVDVKEDGTLAFPPQESAITLYDKYCQQQQYFIGDGSSSAPGTGTWDDQGNLSLTWILRYERVCTIPGTQDPGAPRYRSTTLSTHVFTGFRQQAEPRAPTMAFLADRFTGTYSFSEEKTPAHHPPSTQTQTQPVNIQLQQAGDTRFLFRQVYHYAEGILVEVFEDGTFELPPFTYPPVVEAQGCQRQFYVGEVDSRVPGTGTWDDWGNVTLEWVSRSDNACVSYDGDEYVTRTTNTFEGKRLVW
ncbi:hypothetical protein [Corallococcus llansteffanensis]|uniref:Uncharacterized protein n=1 Tax=Corallococcus llansteffanensis TaxID=2316731 RepID=A0A3A8QKA2_9BACT|nr:hypothetical protein [Corallococcus llansteffanensis]RKH68997.1 hypothetical protein D7V93_00285 [Corallococcus llansteffanensis]